METASMECCGLREISGLSQYIGSNAAMNAFIEETFYSEGDRPDDFHFGGVIFTEAGAKVTYGKRFKAFIETNNLGTVTTLPAFRNPNTGNIVRTFFWIIDRVALDRYARKNKLIGAGDDY
jgi:hypothetical protein